MCSIESLNIHTGQPIHAGYIIRSFKQTFDSVSAVITVKVKKVDKMQIGLYKIVAKS